ncbi:ATP-binding cassette sub-family A member 9-like [Hylobates moloch]|uniref:ATP-binding cassette sub-family A member 9-like n=1 Tax=Hylobates moloch TaxID=81572 RepID=UPI002675C1F2|nr:ATP-binding cassette sub-family A member 9-like [Hylobates moloch]
MALKLFKISVTTSALVGDRAFVNNPKKFSQSFISHDGEVFLTKPSSSCLIQSSYSSIWWPCPRSCLLILSLHKYSLGPLQRLPRLPILECGEPSYWHGKPVPVTQSLLDMMGPVKTPNSEFIEKEPADLIKGIEIQHLYKVYHRGRTKHIAVKCLTMNMYRGQIAVLGHSGAGKTTTCFMLTGLNLYLLTWNSGR